MNAINTPARLRLSRLSRTEPTPFRILPDAGSISELASGLSLLALRKVRFEGTLSPVSRNDWRLAGILGATAVQPCSVTLAPVTTRIDVPVERNYLADFSPPTEVEAEMPEDDSTEPLPEEVDLVEILAESLALALPDFPRAEGVELGESVYSEPGTEPLTDESVKPFAGLADLKKSMEK